LAGRDRICILELKSRILTREKGDFLGEMPELEASEPKLEDGHSDSDKARPQTGAFESRVPVVSDGTVVEAGKTPVIASGGVEEVADIRKLKPIGGAGVIVGRSLYEGTLTLKDALAAAK
jgi:hypothetical protein